MIVMNPHAQARKGQSAIEYLTTYGWALLAIIVVGAVLVNMGVFNQCQQVTPQFSGQDVAIDTWAYTASDNISMTLQAVNNDINVTNVSLIYDSGLEDRDIGASGGLEIAAGNTGTTFVDGLGTSSGACAAADVQITYDITGSDISGAKASSSGKLRGPVP